MEEFYYCEWEEDKRHRKGFVELSRIGNDIAYDKIISMNGPHSMETVNDLLKKWGWKKLTK